MKDYLMDEIVKNRRIAWGRIIFTEILDDETLNSAVEVLEQEYQIKAVQRWYDPVMEYETTYIDVVYDEEDCYAEDSNSVREEDRDIETENALNELSEVASIREGEIRYVGKRFNSTLENQISWRYVWKDRYIEDELTGFWIRENGSIEYHPTITTSILREDTGREYISHPDNFRDFYEYEKYVQKANDNVLLYSICQPRIPYRRLLEILNLYIEQELNETDGNSEETLRDRAERMVQRLLSCEVCKDEIEQLGLWGF